MQRNTAVILSSLGRNVITGQGGSIGEDWWVMNNEWVGFEQWTYLPYMGIYDNWFGPIPMSFPP